MDVGSIRVGPMTLSDVERPDVRKRIFHGILITLVRSATSLLLHKCVARFVSDK